MNGAERRGKIIKLISESDIPLSGGALADKMSVSRQIIVKDISQLKEQGYAIISTNRGYIVNMPPRSERVFKVVHADNEIEKELRTIVSLGGVVKNVFVWHRIYGKIEGALNIASYEDVSEYIESLKSGRSSPLKKVTSEYHYHTVTAADESTLDKIRDALDKMKFLVHDE